MLVRPGLELLERASLTAAGRADPRTAAGLLLPAPAKRGKRAASKRPQARRKAAKRTTAKRSPAKRSTARRSTAKRAPTRRTTTRRSPPGDAS